MMTNVDTLKNRQEGAPYSTISQPCDIDGETITAHSVVDIDGATINDGHFLEQSDADYVCQHMIDNELRGDYVSTLCRSMQSWMHV